jgi:Cellulose-binding protein Sde0182, C-terminal domain
VTLDTAGTRDPDGHTLKYSWFFYPEAGSGIPGQPVFAGGLVPIGGGGTPGEGGIPSGPEGGPREPPARVIIQDAAAPKATVTPRVAGTAHIILAVVDDGTPALTSYRRVILTIKVK